MGKFLGTYMQTCIIKILGNNFQQQWQHPITKKADAEPKKSRSNKKSRCRNSLLKNGPTKLPCLLIILASWVDFLTLDYCSTHSHITPCNAALENHFEWPEPESQSCSASAFPYFEADAEIGVTVIIFLKEHYNIIGGGRAVMVALWKIVLFLASEEVCLSRAILVS